ncbi:hypothetical protein KM043_010937 [Ampulex compressa]|nr:hypothetical protein KM043_010937 [Ampulex compressa]
MKITFGECLQVKVPEDSRDRRAFYQAGCWEALWKARRSFDSPRILKNQQHQNPPLISALNRFQDYYQSSKPTELHHNDSRPVNPQLEKGF